MWYSVEVKLDWTFEVSGFLMGFLKTNHYCTQLFYGQNYFGTLFLVFLNLLFVLLLLIVYGKRIYVALKVHYISYFIWGNA